MYPKTRSHTFPAQVNILNRLPHFFPLVNMSKTSPQTFPAMVEISKNKLPHFSRTGQNFKTSSHTLPTLVKIPKTMAHTSRTGQKKPTQGPTLSAAVKIQLQVPTLFHAPVKIHKQGSSLFPHQSKQQARSHTVSARIEVPKQAPTLSERVIFSKKKKKKGRRTFSALVHIPKTRSLRLSSQHNDCVKKKMLHVVVLARLFCTCGENTHNFVDK